MPHLRHLFLAVLVVTLLAAGCTASPSVTSGEPLPTISPDEFTALLRASDKPVILNVWASWCGPCRSEAPLLRQAYEEFGSRVRFIGADVNDTQTGAQRFIAQYGLDFEHYFDPGSAIPTALRSTGVPHTFFFAPGGELRFSHHGMIDEQTLAIQIDDLLR
ncbi:MAG: redoxin domain-containing protein [Gammaproteobacteria bacterium]|nr:redoxin domain-containing protein [Gammaproteobacteria bacterium]